MVGMPSSSPAALRSTSPSFPSPANEYGDDLGFERPRRAGSDAPASLTAFPTRKRISPLSIAHGPAMMFTCGTTHPDAFNIEDGVRLVECPRGELVGLGDRHDVVDAGQLFEVARVPAASSLRRRRRWSGIRPWTGAVRARIRRCDPRRAARPPHVAVAFMTTIMSITGS